MEHADSLQDGNKTLGSNFSNVSGFDYYTCREANEESVTFQFYVWGIIANVIAAYGIAGNIMSIIVLRHRMMRNSTSYYLISLAVYDIGVLLSMSLFLAIPTIYLEKGHLADYYYAYMHMHPFCYPLALLAQTGTIYTTVGFTSERYIAVCHPLKAPNRCTKSRTKRVIILILIFSVVYNIPRFFEFKTVFNWDEQTNSSLPGIGLTELGKNNRFKLVYFIYMSPLVMFVLPFLIIFVLNIQLMRAVNLAKKTRTRLSTSASKEANLTIMLIAVIIVFLICQLPSIADNILWVIFDSADLNCSLSYIRFTSITNLMVVINSAVNFVLYCAFGKRFRRVFVKTICHPWRKRQPRFKYTMYESAATYNNNSRRVTSLKIMNSDSTFL
ncbi:hypothetical protein FSP39_022705 [Pinctada imbricata]|uniref:G-protein coupled receptors family 1 profile domain-containing protein n=1 Tax=Pinctada imbricata TaxID=66713 RepID=A0AA88XLZ6_PINIB|nr:hypothetical protein FSP39_022705 [Pinctada imbricata]